MTLVECGIQHAPEILEIFNHEILNSTGLYDYHARTAEDMERWFEAKRRGRYPVIGALDGDGSLAGFATYGSFRSWPAYKYSVEHSVYIRKDCRGRGFAKTLMRDLIGKAQAQDYHMLIGGIDSGNAPSIRLHRSLGFTQCASIKHAGYKFGRWLDLEFYQLILPTPHAPRDG
jgi:L-amino acid N-acyltransferase